MKSTVKPEQLPLFDQKGRPGHFPPPLTQLKEVTPSSTLASAMAAYHKHLKASGYSPHTVKSFSGDIGLLKNFLGANKLIGDVSTQDLENFLSYLREGRLETQKSITRRVTSLKHLFGWLKHEELISQDPAARLIYKKAVSPLPVVLFEDECQRLLKEASKNPRDYTLVLLLLEAGLKREELLSLKVENIDLSDRYRPEVRVSSKNPTRREC